MAEEWVEIETTHKLADGMFVAQVHGRSMEPAIPDGAYCLFKRAPEGTRHGLRIMLKPLNPESRPITIEEANEGQFRVVAEFVDVVGLPELAPTGKPA